MSPLTPTTLLHAAAALLLYGAVLNDAVGQSWLALLQALQTAHMDATAAQACQRAYGAWFRAIAATGHTWSDHLLLRVLHADNPFTDQAQRQDFGHLSPALKAAVVHDLQHLQTLSSCPPAQLAQWVQQAAQLPTPPVAWDGAPLADPPAIATVLQATPDWPEHVGVLAAHHHEYGTGEFARYRAFRWHQGQLVGIAHPDAVPLSALVGYEAQKAAVCQNTECLLRGYPALHVLLYGSRGAGKSSLVKGMLTEFGDRGLRLVEVAKAELHALPVIVDDLRDRPQKFILFVDDLSFEADEDHYKALKAVLEGSLTARPQNVVVYATSNRRHLIREFFGDRPRPRDADEIHQWDTVQEKLSFSDRFGLTLTFEPANQDTYLAIVQHLARHAGLQLPPDELDDRARQWATRHNGRSGRSARQFIDYLQGEQKLQ